MPKRALPITNEFLLLWAIRGIEEGGSFGLELQRSIKKCSFGLMKLPIGSIYTVLAGLENQEYVETKIDAINSGGAPRKYYRLTQKGVDLIEQTEAVIEALKCWQPEKLN